MEDIELENEILKILPSIDGMWSNQVFRKLNVSKERYTEIRNKMIDEKWIKGTISYILSHAGIKKRRHTLTWWGELSYSKLKLEKDENDENRHRCTQCNAVYKPLICFKDGFRCKPPPTEVIIEDDPFGWEYLEDFYKGISF